MTVYTHRQFKTCIMELIILLLTTIGAQAIRLGKSMSIYLVVKNSFTCILLLFSGAFLIRTSLCFNLFLLLSFRALSCPNYCPKTIEPVCGEDGKIYR